MPLTQKTNLQIAEGVKSHEQAMESYLEEARKRASAAWAEETRPDKKEALNLMVDDLTLAMIKALELHRITFGIHARYEDLIGGGLAETGST